MLETSRIYAAIFGALRVSLGSAALLLAACAAMEPEQAVQAPVAARMPQPAPATPPADPRAVAEEARALLAQAETDIQRARARKALWARAWGALVAARAANGAQDDAATIRNARRASELAQLGLEQLAYPPVTLTPAAAEPAASKPTDPQRAVGK
jgi:uncharacterized lipoprotein YmbA